MKNTKKGFTITELVIVIAVIAILAAVLIPTFSSVVKKANESKAMQEARSYVVEYNAENAEDMLEFTTTPAQTEYYIVVGKYVVKYSANGYDIHATAVDESAALALVSSVAADKVTDEIYKKLAA